MKIPVSPPDHTTVLKDLLLTNQDMAVSFVERGIPPTDNKGRYLHWDKLRHLEPPQ